MPMRTAASRSVKPDRRKAASHASGPALSRSTDGRIPRLSAADLPPLVTAVMSSRSFGESVRPSWTEISGPPTAATASAPLRAIRSARVSAFVRLRARCASRKTSTASLSSPHAAPGSCTDAATVPSGPPRFVFSS